ncbi:MAG: hypothetical protein WAK01_11735 [Methylocystis sp.]
MLRVDLLESEGHAALEATLRQARRPPLQEGQDAQKKQPGDQEAEREIQRLLNQHAPPHADRAAPLSPQEGEGQYFAYAGKLASFSARASRAEALF